MAATRDGYGQALLDLAVNEKVVVLEADLGKSTKSLHFRKQFPERTISCGIGEQNMLLTASGIASSGYNVFVYAIGPHVVYRAYEQIRNDVCLNNSNVKIVSIGSGLHYADHGPTHHSTEDFGVLKVLPSMKIFSPCGDEEVRQITNYLAKLNGPSYLRLGRGIDKNFNIKFPYVFFPFRIVDV